MLNSSDSIILEQQSYSRENAVHESSALRQMWLAKHQAHSQKLVDSDSSLPQDFLEDYSQEIIADNGTLRSIDKQEPCYQYNLDNIGGKNSNQSRAQDSTSIIIPNPFTTRRQQQLSNKKISDDEQIILKMQPSATSRLNLDNANQFDLSMDQISVQDSESKSPVTNKKFYRQRNSMRRSQKIQGSFPITLLPFSKSLPQGQISIKKDYYKILLFYNRFRTMLAAMLIYLRPSRLTPFQMKMIGDASHDSVAHQADGLSTRCLNITKIMYALKFEYGFLRNKATYQRFQKLLIKVDKLLYLFIELGLLFKKLLNCIGTHIPYINPFSPLFLLWEFFVLLIILHLLFIIPYRVGFIQSDEPSVKYLNLEFYFLILDSVLKLNKKTYIEGYFTQDRYKIFKHYLQNEALYDFLSLYVLQLTPSSWWTLFFVIKCLQLRKMINKVKQDLLTSEKLNSLLDLIILLYRLLMFTHIFACLWNWIGIQEQNSGINSWITYYESDQQSAIDCYITALYFSVISMCTIGYGDITPQTIQERAFTIVMILISTVYIGYNINSVGLILENLNKQDKQLTDHLRRVNTFMRTHKIDKDLQDKTRKAISNIYLQQEMSKQTNPVDQLEGVSKFLKDEILCNAYMQAVRANKFFSSCSRTFQEKLALQFQEQFYIYEEEIVKQNEEKDYTPTIYYIAQGRVDLYLQIGSTQKIVRSIGAGEYFGQQEFFTGANASILSVKSTDMTYVYYLTLENFLNVAQAFPEDKQLFLHNRDTIQYRKDYSAVGVKCWGCNTSSHTIEQCPIFFYGCRNRYLQCKINEKKRALKKNFKRRQVKNQKKFHTLKQLNVLAEDAADFIEDNSSLISFIFDQQDFDAHHPNLNEGPHLQNNHNFRKNSEQSLDEQKQEKHLSQRDGLQRQKSNGLSVENIQYLTAAGLIAPSGLSRERTLSHNSQQQANQLQIIQEISNQEDLEATAQFKTHFTQSVIYRSNLSDPKDQTSLYSNYNSNIQVLPGQNQLWQNQEVANQKPQRKPSVSSSEHTIKTNQRPRKTSFSNKNQQQNSDLEKNHEINLITSKASFGTSTSTYQQAKHAWQIPKLQLISQEQNTTRESMQNIEYLDTVYILQNYLPQNCYERVIKQYNYYQTINELNILIDKKRVNQQKQNQINQPQITKQRLISYYLIQQLSEERLENVQKQQMVIIKNLRGTKNMRKRGSNYNI